MKQGRIRWDALKEEDKIELNEMFKRANEERGKRYQLLSQARWDAMREEDKIEFHEMFRRAKEERVKRYQLLGQAREHAKGNGQ